MDYKFKSDSIFKNNKIKYRMNNAGRSKFTSKYS